MTVRICCWCHATSLTNSAGYCAGCSREKGKSNRKWREAAQYFGGRYIPFANPISYVLCSATLRTPTKRMWMCDVARKAWRHRRSERLKKANASYQERKRAYGREYRPMWAAKNPDKIAAYRERARPKRIEQKRQRRATFLAAGLTTNGTPRIVPKWDSSKRLEREARAAAISAWRWYIHEGASDARVAAHYEALGRPWANPRLNSAEQWAVRYASDPIFRQREIHRSGRRRAYIKSIDDGTVDFPSLYRERKSCPYCGRRLKWGEAALDHMDPVSGGGQHSASNITICCKPCNRSKRDMPFDKWLSTLPPGRAGVAERLYARKHGAPSTQQNFSRFFRSTSRSGAQARENRLGEMGL